MAVAMALNCLPNPSHSLSSNPMAQSPCTRYTLCDQLVSGSLALAVKQLVMASTSTISALDCSSLLTSWVSSYAIFLRKVASSYIPLFPLGQGGLLADDSVVEVQRVPATHPIIQQLHLPQGHSAAIQPLFAKAMILPQGGSINNFSMLIHTRTKLTSKKLASSITANPILTHNPQIQMLVDRLLDISESIPEQRPKTLNLVQWQKEKYRPSENENRIRIENQASLIRVCNMQERVRSRVKTILRAQSIDLGKPAGKSYKEHYEEIKEGLARKMSCEQAVQSQEERQVVPVVVGQRGSIKYLHDLRKYNKIVQYISEKTDKRTLLSHKGLRSYYSQSLPTSPDAKPSHLKIFSATVKGPLVKISGGQGDERVNSIVRKWKPTSKIERIFSKTSDPGNRKRPLFAHSVQEIPLEPSLKTYASISDTGSLGIQSPTKNGRI